MQVKKLVLVELCRCRLTVFKPLEIVTVFPLGFTIHNQKPPAQRERDLLVMVAVNNELRSVSC